MIENLSHSPIRCIYFHLYHATDKTANHSLYNNYVLNIAPFNIKRSKAYTRRYTVQPSNYAPRLYRNDNAGHKISMASNEVSHGIPIESIA